MNTTINEAISRKRKTDIANPIRRNTHLISNRTNRYTTTKPNNDHAATLTFVSNHTHTTVHANLSTNFMLIPEVRLFLCFVISFLFPIPHYRGHPNRLFSVRLAKVSQRCDTPNSSPEGFCTKSSSFRWAVSVFSAKNLSSSPL